MALKKFIKLTRIEYTNLALKDENTEYTVVEPEGSLTVYVGDKLVGGVETIPITYVDLYSLWYDQELVPGRKYLITDFKSIYKVHNPLIDDYEVRESDVIEPLLIEATSENTFNPLVQSLLYPNDIIHYSIVNDFNKWSWVDSTSKGVIFKRVDEKNNDISFDFRHIKLPLLEYDLNRIPTWSSSVSYGIGAVVKDTSKIYVSMIKDNLNKPLTQRDSWHILVDDYRNNKKYFAWNSVSSETGNSLARMYFGSDLENYGSIAVDVPIKDNVKYMFMFSEISGDGYNNSDTIHNNSFNFTGLYVNIFYGDIVYDNTFGSNVEGNTFGGSVSSNTFSGSVSLNTFSGNVSKNIFSGNVDNNTFSGGVNFNTFSGSAQINAFSSDVSNNTFSGNVGDNTFSGDVSNNTFSGDVSNNTFSSIVSNNEFGMVSGNTFSDNVSYNAFIGNVTNNTFSDNVSYNAFIGNVDYNTFSGNVTNNTFSVFVGYNTFSGSVGSTTFSGVVDSNTFETNLNNIEAIGDIDSVGIFNSNILETSIGVTIRGDNDYGYGVAILSYYENNVLITEVIGGL